MPALAFLLDAPLQSWGTASRFQHRGTDAHPSKSGVLGLIAATLGIARGGSDEEARLRGLSRLWLTTFRIPRQRPRRGALDSALLTERLNDYHTIGGGRDKTTSLGRLQIPRKAGDGPFQKVVSFGTVVTQREYLLEAVFAAALEGDAADQALLDEIARALRDPTWGVWLGRKCCVPAAPVHARPGPDVASALAALLALARQTDPWLAEGAPEDFDRRTDAPLLPGEGADDGAFTASDLPLSFGDRRHAARRVRHLRAGQGTAPAP